MLAKFKKKLKTNEAENRQKIKSSHNSRFTGSYKKEREYMHIILVSITLVDMIFVVLILKTISG